MGALINRGLSLLFYCGCLAAGYFSGAGVDTLIIAVALLLPMGCIWFPEAFGGYTGMSKYHFYHHPHAGDLHLRLWVVFALAISILLYFAPLPTLK